MNVSERRNRAAPPFAAAGGRLRRRPRTGRCRCRRTHDAPERGSPCSAPAPSARAGGCRFRRRPPPSSRPFPAGGGSVSPAFRPSRPSGAEAHAVTAALRADAPCRLRSPRIRPDRPPCGRCRPIAVLRFSR